MARPNQHRIIIREAGESLEEWTVFDYGDTWSAKEVANGAEPGFEVPAYAAAGFTTQTAAFGYVLTGDQTQGVGMPPCVMNRALVATTWTLGTDLLLRKSIKVPLGTSKLYVELGVDNGAYVYLDGLLVGEVHNDSQACQTRGSSSFWVESPPTGWVTLAVRAIDNAQSEPGGTDGYAGVLKESFFDMKLVAFGTSLADTIGGGGTVLQTKVEHSSQGFGCTATFASATTAGNLIIAIIARRDAIPGVESGWTNLAGPVQTGQLNGLDNSGDWMRAVYRISAGEQTFTFSTSPSSNPTPLTGDSLALCVYELDIQNFDPNNDLTAYTADFQAAATNLSIGAITNPSGAAQILMGLVYDTQFTYTVPATPGTGWVSDANQGINLGGPYDRHPWMLAAHWNGTTDPLTARATIGSAMPWAGLVLWLRGESVTGVLATGGRGPEAITAVIDDAKAVGLSKFHNGAGELYFTLQNFHPAINLVRPWRDHWAYEVYTAEGWVEKSAGWIVDYDAADEETIFYGIDYLGVLGLMADERFNADQSPETAAVLWPDDQAGTAGAKYTDQRIDAIIIDQLQRAIHAPNSNLGFMTLGGIASMSETVSIYCTLAERLSFIVGLIDSHRAGTGAQTRLVVTKWGEGDYRFEVVESPGILRNDLTVRDGELVQGFRLIPFGDYANRALAIGKTSTGFRLEYDIEQTPPPAGEATDYYENLYGRQSKVNYWNDIIDINDLKRRALQYAATVGALGKKLGLGLRVDVFGVEDGWTIGDSMPVEIARGPIDTSTMGPNGDGTWTIWGWALFIDADGHTDLTLTLLPRELSGTLDPDLATSVTIQPPNDITVDDTDPTTTVSPGTAATWFNTATGHVWIVDPATGLWYDATAAGDMTAIAIPLTVKDEGIALATSASVLDFVGDGVTASGAGATKTITIPRLTVKDEGVALATTAASIDFVGGGVVASGTGADKTVTIEGVTSALVEAAGHWEVLMADGLTAPPDPLQTETEDDWLYGWISG